MTRKSIDDATPAEWDAATKIQNAPSTLRNFYSKIDEMNLQPISNGYLLIVSGEGTNGFPKYGRYAIPNGSPEVKLIHQLMELEVVC